MKEKLELYKENGVREYWIVDPGNRCVHIYRPAESRYGEPAVHLEDQTADSATCPGLTIPLAQLFRLAATPPG